MKFETKPFDDYESITLNELKDKTNSLLNLVTEELRPLTVTMKNGKEFLLFPRELLEPLYDQDFRAILLSAKRYSMGRWTYMPQVVADYIKRYVRLLDDKFLALAVNDIRRHLEDYVSMSRIQICGRSYWSRSKRSREIKPPMQRNRQDCVLRVGTRWRL